MTENRARIFTWTDDSPGRSPACEFSSKRRPALLNARIFRGWARVRLAHRRDHATDGYWILKSDSISTTVYGFHVDML
jgi:hypothetical protein